jgi:hypothetical protein
MTNRSHQHAEPAGTNGARLSPEDVNALRRTARDLSDIDPQTIARAQAGFRHAYEVAQRICEGTLDPLST